MNFISKFAIATALIGLAGLTNHATVRAEDALAAVTLKPISGPGAPGGGQQSLLNTVVGTKQAVSYFLSENGLCKVTVMVADAFNGVDVPDSAAVRFEVALSVGGSARMDTAEGKSLEFACQQHAQELTVRTGSQKRTYASGT